MNLEEKILEELNNTKEGMNRRAISISLNEELIKKVDRIAREFSKISSTKNYSRNSIIEDATEEYVKTSENLLKKNFNIDINDEETIEDIDLAIFPAIDGERFREAFFNEKIWPEAKISDKRIEDIKYIAIYVGAPTSAITHYAKVKMIEGKETKNIILEEPITLKNKVILGSLKPFRNVRYSTLKKLLKAKELKELF